MLKIIVALGILIILILYQSVIAKNIAREADYEASGDYFEVVTMTTGSENLKSTTSISTESSSSDEDSDDGVTCSDTNITQVLSNYELENFVLVLFKVNVSVNEKELFYFLNLAKRFANAPSIFSDHKFIVLTMDQSSEIVNDFIEKEDYQADIIAIDESEYPDLGFVIDFDELHVHVVDQCGKLTYIIVPPYSSAQQPYVKSAVLSTIIDFPCGCPATELFSNRLDATLASMDNNDEQSGKKVEETIISTTNNYAETDGNSTTTKILLNDDDEIENINDVIDNPNNLLESSSNSSDNSTIPLRIILPSEHVHYDNDSQTYFKYQHIILRSDDNNYHEHFGEESESLIDINNDRFQNFTSEKLFVGNNSLDDIKAMSNGKILLNKLGFAYKIHKERGENFFEIEKLEYDVVKVPPFRQMFGVERHYQQLNKWLNFSL